MNNSNVKIYRGFKKLFYGQLIPLLVIIGVFILTLILLSMPEMTVWMLAGLVIIIGVLASLASIVIFISGLHTLSKVSSAFRIAFILQIITIVISVLGSVVENFSINFASFVSLPLSIASLVIPLFNFYYIYRGITEIMKPIDEHLARRAKTIWILYLVSYILLIISTVALMFDGVYLVLIMNQLDTSAIATPMIILLIALVILLAAFILDIIYCIMFLHLLWKCYKATVDLEEVQTEKELITEDFTNGY